MPIEVKELVIKVRIEDQVKSDSTVNGNGGRRGLSEKEFQHIVAACAEEVLKILNRQKEK